MNLATFILLLYIPIVIILTITVIQFFKLIKLLQYTCQTLVSIEIDKSVDEICKKAVIVAEDIFRSQDKTNEKVQQKITEKASSIVADVLLQHGLNPRNYHIPALVGVARYREGFDYINKE